MRGAPLPTIQELLGHSTIQMIMRYSHLSPEAKLDAVQLLHSNGKTAAQKNDGLQTPSFLLRKGGSGGGT